MNKNKFSDLLGRVKEAREVMHAAKAMGNANPSDTRVLAVKEIV